MSTKKKKKKNSVVPTRPAKPKEKNDDSIQVKVGVSHNGLVLISYSSPVSYLSMEPQEAMGVAQMLLESSKEAIKQKQSKIILTGTEK